MIRKVQLSDASRIAEIYNYYIENTVVTFEEERIDAGEIERRIKSVEKKNYPYLVYEENGTVLAYACLDNWRSRAAYNITLETSIYLDVGSRNKGTGTMLYKALIDTSQTMDVHSLIGGISLPNDASRKLHEKFGFHLVGNFRESGRKFGQLIDVEFWQLMIN